MLAVGTYLLARLGLFAACAVVLDLLGAAPIVALLGGLVISLLLSYLLLRRLRVPATAAIAERVQARAERRAAQPDEDVLIEDAQVDEILREGDRQA